MLMSCSWVRGVGFDVGFDEVAKAAAHDAVEAASPHEVDLLADLLNPPRRWWGSRAVGFGSADTVQWVSPFVVAAVAWYGRIWFDEGKSAVEAHGRKLARKLARRLAGNPDPEPVRPRPMEPMSAVTIEEHIRQVRQYLAVLGLDDIRAELIARAVVARFVDHTDG